MLFYIILHNLFFDFILPMPSLVIILIFQEDFFEFFINYATFSVCLMNSGRLNKHIFI